MDVQEDTCVFSASIVHIGRLVDLSWQIFNLNLESLLYIVQNLLVFLRRNKGDGQTLGTVPTCSADTMQVLICLGWHIIVDYDIDFFNVNSSSK